MRWDAGEIGPSEALFAASFSSPPNLGPFARLCQSAHALSRVLAHRSAAPTSPDRSALLAEALGLHRMLVALDAHLAARPDADGRSSGADLGLCCSARMTLYNMYGCNEPGGGDGTSAERIAMETEMQAASLDGLKEIVGGRVIRLAQMAARGAQAVVDDVGLEAGEGTPLVLKCLYHAGTEAKWFIRENYDVGMVVALQAVTNALRAVGSRWKVARECPGPFSRFWHK